MCSNHISGTTLRPYGLRVAQPEKTVRLKQCPAKLDERSMGKTSGAKCFT
ncbi:MAG: hypothetical protein SFW63_06715 [Alphaproteobacteria bacterium]|nr:hypothetical protein [Alphaproteobacteria bacterium]